MVNLTEFNNSRMYRFQKVLHFAISAVLISFTSNAQIWQTTVPDYGSLSSPRVIDLDEDGLPDVVIGDGNEVDSIGRVRALSGLTGDELWSVTFGGEVYTSAQFIAANADAVPDIVMGGRVSTLACIDGLSGNPIWTFDISQPSPLDQGWLQFYEPKTIRDRNADGIKEILVMNGGDPTAAPGQPLRKPGHLLMLDGATGEVMHAAMTPDSAESYSSLVLVETINDNTSYIFFGTGGETVKGSMWRCSITDLINGSLENATEVASGSNKGFIAPPVLADINQDGALDIVAAGMDGTLTVTDGVTLETTWNFSDPSLETYSVPALGDLNGDNVPDVMVNFNKGQWPQYIYSVQLVFSGVDGTLLIADTVGLQFSSNIMIDADGDNVLNGITMASPGYSFGECAIVVHTHAEEPDTLLSIPDCLNIGSTPAFADLTGNGLLELITLHQTDTCNHVISAWSTSILASYSPWSSYHGSFNDGIYYETPPVSVDEPPSDTAQTQELTATDGYVSFKDYLLLDVLGRCVAFGPTIESLTESNYGRQGLYIVKSFSDPNMNMKLWLP